MNIIVYAISCRNGGALSVLTDFYNEAKTKADKYPDVCWIFILSTQYFENTKNIQIFNYEWSIKTWFHRWWFNNITVKKLVTHYSVKTIYSLQNMGVFQNKTQNIISLHNVLPFYKCGKDVLDSRVLRIKQRFVNYYIIRSLTKAYAIFVPDKWIKDKIVNQIGVDEKKIYISPLNISNTHSGDVNIINSPRTSNNGTMLFFYPAGALPYKNHKLIVDACIELEALGVTDYEVLFTFNVDKSRTARNLHEIIENNNLKISFIGELPREQVLELYRTGVLIFPSKIETDAMPLIECAEYGGYALVASLPYSHATLDAYSGKSFFESDNVFELCRLMKLMIEDGIPRNRKWLYSVADFEKSRLDNLVKLARECYQETK